MKTQIFMWCLVCVSLSAGGLLRYFLGPGVYKTIDKLSPTLAALMFIWGFTVILTFFGWLAVHLWMKFK